jgi:hypothetical protein
MTNADTSKDGDKATAATSGDGAGFMKGVVIFLGVLLIAGFVLIFSTIIYRMVKLADDDGPAEKAGAVALADVAVAEGAQVQAMTLDGNRLAIHVGGEAGEEIVIVDVRRGTVLSRVRVTPGDEK